jgi:ribonuclease Z
MIIVPLGVASATPTKTRHLSATAVWRDGQTFLFDCGENTQMRMLQAGMKRSKIDYIFISHFDVDHYIGIVGVISTLQLQRRDDKLTLVGPKGLKDFVEWNLGFANIEIGFPIEFIEIEEGFDHLRLIDEDDYYVEARPLDHTKFCIGYRLQEKDLPGKVDAEKAKSQGISEDWQYKELKAGRDVTLPDGTVVEAADIVGPSRKGDSFAYCMDTRYCENAVKLGEKASVLYHESTFGKSLEEKAQETGHSTSVQAAKVAKEADAKLLVISHFSARYTNEFVLLREAKEVFNSTWLATELRPIMTDFEHEKGIIEPTVEIREKKNNDKRGRGGKKSRGGRKRRGSSSGGGYKKKRFRKRRSYNSGSSSSGDKYRRRNNNSKYRK